MEMINKAIQYTCVGLLFSILAMPILKEHSGLLSDDFNVEELQGYFEPVDSVEFSMKTWFSGEYQKKKEEYLKRNLEISPFAFRVNKQLHRDVFNELSGGVEEGRDGYLFESLYISAFLGQNYIGEDSIVEQSHKLKFVSQQLKQRYDTDLMVAIALDKADYFREKLPKEYLLENKEVTNYETYLEVFERDSIHVVDINQYFKALKSQTEHPLATKYGIHWSMYGALIAADSILQYAGDLRDRKVNRLISDDVVTTTEPKKEDIDIGQSINLYRPLESQTYSYMQNYFTPEKKEYRPDVMLIGDSFCWTIWNQYVPQEYWGPETKFLYYYNQIWETTGFEMHGSFPKDVQKYELAKSTDVIVLLYTPMNMNDLGNGFIDEMYDELKHGEL